MKPLFLLFLFVLSASASDIRSIGGRSVDLQPIKDWERTHRGERPMQHWKKVEFISSVSQLSAWRKCKVLIEGEAPTEVLMANLPTEAKNHFDKLQNLSARVSQLSTYVENEDRRIRQVDAVTPTGAAGNAAYVNAVMAQRAQVNYDAEVLRDRKRELDRLASELEDEIKITVTDYAMFTGSKYSGLQIWDCGQKH